MSGHWLPAHGHQLPPCQHPGGSLGEGLPVGSADGLEVGVVGGSVVDVGPAVGVGVVVGSVVGNGVVGSVVGVTTAVGTTVGLTDGSPVGLAEALGTAGSGAGVTLPVGCGATVGEPADVGSPEGTGASVGGGALVVGEAEAKGRGRPPFPAEPWPETGAEAADGTGWLGSGVIIHTPSSTPSAAGRGVGRVSRAGAAAAGAFATASTP